MKVDYTKYSAQSLLSARAGIDRSSSNYEPLLKEIEERKDEILAYQKQEQDKAFSIAEKRVKVIGYFQLAAAAAIFFYLVTGIFDGTLTLLSFLLAVITITLNVVAGITAINENYQFYWVTILNQAIQVPAIAIGSIQASYSGLGGAYFYITDKFNLGLSASFSPGFSFQSYDGALASQYVAIDILAIVFITAVITVKDAKETANKAMQQTSC